MAQRLYLVGFQVTPQLVVGDDEAEVARVLPHPTISLSSVPDLEQWVAERWPADFERMKTELAKDEEAERLGDPELHPDGTAT